jgi:hypothetical protein
MFLTVAAALAWTIAGMTKDRTSQLLVDAVFFVLLAGALWSTVVLIVYTAISWKRDWVDADQANDLARVQAEHRLAETLRYMTDEQLNAFGRHRVGMEIIPGTGGPIYTLILPFARVPFDFIETFVSHSTQTHLAAVRRWSEGSNARGYADALTKYFIDDGYADYDPGNQAAYWLSAKARHAGLVSIGYEEAAE